MWGISSSPKNSVDSRGNCAGMLSIEHINTPLPEKLRKTLIKLTKIIEILIAFINRQSFTRTQ